MAFANGKDGEFKIDNSAGSLTDRSSLVLNLTHSLMQELKDITTWSKSFRVRKGVLKDFEAQVEMLFDTASYGDFLALFGSDRTVNIGPAGTTAGYPKISGEMLVENISAPQPVDDVVKFTMSLKANDTITVGTY